MLSVCVSFDGMGYACFKAIHDLGGNIGTVVTLEDSLRDIRSGQCPFEPLAEEVGAPLWKCRNINEPKIIEALADLRPDAIFIIGWSQLVKPEFIRMGPRGVFGMHPTMLPKHRGRAPLPWSMIFGLRTTAVSLFYIAEEADNGNLVGQIEIPIYRVDTAESLYDRVVRATWISIRHYYPLIERGEAPRIVQDTSRASGWERRRPADGIIDWATGAEALYDWVRALGRPYPGAFTYSPAGRTIVWATDLPVPLTGGSPGKIVQIDCRGILVQCGSGGLWLTRITSPDGEELEGHEIARSRLMEVGQVLG